LAACIGEIYFSLEMYQVLSPQVQVRVPKYRFYAQFSASL